MARDRPPPQAPQAVLVGRVLRPHGVRGEVVVEPWSDLPDRFSRGHELELVTPSGERRRVRIAASRGHHGTLLVRLEGLGDRDAAEELRGAELLVARDASPAAPTGAYYFYELAGCRCEDARAGALGEVEEVLEDGGGLLLRVVAPGRVLLVPFVHEYVEAVDPSEGLIRLCLPEGLIETCASTS